MRCSGSDSRYHTGHRLHDRKPLYPVTPAVRRINQLGEFGSVSAALTRGQTARPRRVASPYLVTLDALWDRERWGPSAIADAFGSAIEGAVRQYIEESETSEQLFNALVCFRLALSCQTDFVPYENDPGARAETGRRNSDVIAKVSGFKWAPH